MSLPTDITLGFADGEYRFALLLPQQLELEKVCGFVDRDGNQRRRGLVEIYSDVVAGLGVVDGQIVANPYAGRASAYETREVIRLGLIGGGRGEAAGQAVEVGPNKARELVEAYVDSRPIVERWTIAAAILKAAVEGFDPPKKAEPAAAPARGARAGRKTKASASTK